ncbi:MAG TPA: DNA repair exonuclease [Polyangiales bacterium]|nr:DNA repair exonuclease [Polyangiales bacterium]
MKFVHAADLHLDSPLRGLARYAGAPVDEMRLASRRACENLVELCIDEEAQLLLLAGDLYDGDWRDYSTGLFFSEQLTRLREAGVQVVFVRGNHDAASQITRHLRLPDNVRELAVHSAETICFDDLGVAVHGQGFATRAVTENLAQSYPERIPQLLNIGLLHTSVNGRQGHENYAPCTLEQLKHKGYEYWALGHVHAREVLSQAPWVVFSGNLQGRHARETGEKGASLVTYDAHGIQRVEHRALDVVRYAALRVDVRQASSFDAALERVRDALAQLAAAADRTTAVRVSLFGGSPAHAQLHARDTALLENVRALATDAGAGSLWVEKLLLETRPLVPAFGARAEAGAIGELLAYLSALRNDDAALLELAEQELCDLRVRLPSELRDGVEGLRLSDPDHLRSELDAVEQLLLARLYGEEAPP